jgi:hypothetical protein
MGTYHRAAPAVALAGKVDAAALQLPEPVSVALHEVAGAVKEGLLALAVGTVMHVMHAMHEENVSAIVGAQGQAQPGTHRGPPWQRGQQRDLRRRGKPARGLHETLTVQRLQLGARLTRVLRSADAIESMLSRGRTVARNVTRFRDGEMALRWTAAGMSEAQKSFRRIKGHRELGLLRAALTAHVEADIDTNRRVA